MAFNLPLPNPFSWSIPAKMQELNEVQKGTLENRYSPMSKMAQAASQLAYARLMGPQFMAKALGNEGIRANLSDPQLKQALDLIYGAGSGQGTGANALNQMPGSPENGGIDTNNPIGSLLEKIVGSTRNALFGGSNSQPQSSNALAQQPNLSAQDRNALGNMHPGDSYQIQGNQQAQPQTQPVAPQPMANGPSRQFPENEGKYKGIVSEGQELGKIRAENINDLDNQYQQAIQAEVPIKHLMDMSQSPTFMNMRNKIPFFQDKQLQALSKIGTPEEQKIIGDFTTTAQNAVANTVSAFKGRILDKEITMANNMKISPNDTWNVMLGKLASIETFNQMTKQRARIAAQLMQQEHINKGDALERADKQIDGMKIRQSVERQLNPPVSEDDINYMATTHHITPDEVRKRVKKKGYKLEIELKGEK